MGSHGDGFWLGKNGRNLAENIETGSTTSNSNESNVYEQSHSIFVLSTPVEHQNQHIHPSRKLIINISPIAGQSLLGRWCVQRPRRGRGDTGGACASQG